MAYLIYNGTLKSSSEDPDPLDPQDFGFLDLNPDPQKYADPDPRGKISKKNAKKKTFLLLKPKSELLKEDDYINFLIFEWF